MKHTHLYSRGKSVMVLVSASFCQGAAQSTTPPHCADLLGHCSAEDIYTSTTAGSSSKTRPVMSIEWWLRTGVTLDMRLVSGYPATRPVFQVSGGIVGVIQPDSRIITEIKLKWTVAKYTIENKNVHDNFHTFTTSPFKIKGAQTKKLCQTFIELLFLSYYLI